MRLIKLKFKNFRRFAEEVSLDLNEDVIALVGPNEAGKSSVLRAIDLVGGKEVPSPNDATRGLGSEATLSALFALDPEDRSLLNEIHEGPEVSRIWLHLKGGTSGSTWTPEPWPHRDLRPRTQCLEVLQALEGDAALDGANSDSDEWRWDPQRYVDVKSSLASRDDRLPSEAITAMEDLAHRLRDIRDPDLAESEETHTEESQTGETESEGLSDANERATRRESAASVLLTTASHEKELAPVNQVITALSERTPEVAFFREEDRELQSTYTLNEVAANPPPALRNLCALAGIDLVAVRNEIASGRIPHVEALFEAANGRLRERFRNTWSQSEVYPRLSTPLDGTMRVLVAVEGGGEYSYPEERSDGLRWFMALHSFLAARGETEPILLVDEAETHLHYDAQADLIDALMSQRIARQVIYTTHSVGCLPPDLGCGIRVVLAKEGAERSLVANSYWSVPPGEGDKVGYTPLLFAMGAQLLSLTIPRFGLIAEGPADAILLPTLMRQAAGLRRLPYRVVPGLSEVAKSNVSSLLGHGGKVVMLTDGDPGGHQICRTLQEGGIAADLIFDLGQVRPGCTLEDLVDRQVFASAVNSELETWGIGPMRVAVDDLPDVGRWAWLVERGEKSRTPIDRLSKSRVAQRVVDVSRNGDETAADLMDATDAGKLGQLHGKLCSALGIEPGSKDVSTSR